MPFMPASTCWRQIKGPDGGGYVDMGERGPARAPVSDCF